MTLEQVGWDLVCHQYLQDQHLRSVLHLQRLVDLSHSQLADHHLLHLRLHLQPLVDSRLLLRLLVVQWVDLLRLLVVQLYPHLRLRYPRLGELLVDLLRLLVAQLYQHLDLHLRQLVDLHLRQFRGHLPQVL